MIYRKGGGTRGRLIAPEEGIMKVKGVVDNKKTTAALKKLYQEPWTPVTVEYLEPRKRR